MDLKPEVVKIENLQPYDNNARKHQKADLEAIKASIQEFGFNDPVGVWGPENIIVEGHGRVLAAMELGIEKIPVIHLDHLTDEQRRAYGLAHNRTAELSEWDLDVMEAELADIYEIDMDAFGFDEFGPVQSEEVEEDDFEIGEPEPRTKRGDVWVLGDHELLCGDSTDPAEIAEFMGGVQGRPPADRPALQRRLHREDQGRPEDPERQHERSELPGIFDGRDERGNTGDETGGRFLHLVCLVGRF